MTLTPAAVESIQTLCVGLALSGLIASAFELFAERRASFQPAGAWRGRGRSPRCRCWPSAHRSSSCATPCAAAASRGGRSPSSILATMIACGWGLLSGRVALDLAAMLVGA